MALKAGTKTPKDRLLKVISVLDTAIDWEKSYSEDRDLSEDGKQNSYLVTHDISQLVFLEGEKPTLCVFKHPARVEVSRKVRAAYTRHLSNMNGKSDLFTEIFNIAFLGKQEGLDSESIAEAPRRDGVITDDYMQEFEDCGAFEEIGAYLIAVINKKVDSEAKKK